MIVEIEQTTKSGYYYKNEDMKDFLFNFEIYVKSKQYNDDCKKKVIGLHVSDKVKVWVHKLMKAAST
ncbi:7289_t:CDS:2 [Cetraspora pellucida]|uniref:7289_t:CDS:1 n=1 Tax=Cetraspora pellucida TaxID=1433469 RepID=A0A9N9I0H5_9GLOM|nr:7289_t:CDS:2 [Cetraspora pellucida]